MGGSQSKDQPCCGKETDISLSPDLKADVLTDSRFKNVSVIPEIEGPFGSKIFDCIDQQNPTKKATRYAFDLTGLSYFDKCRVTKRYEKWMKINQKEPKFSSVIKVLNYNHDPVKDCLTVIVEYDQQPTLEDEVSKHLFTPADVEGYLCSLLDLFLNLQRLDVSHGQLT